MKGVGRAARFTASVSRPDDRRGRLHARVGDRRHRALVMICIAGGAAMACGPGVDEGTFGVAGLGEACDVSLDCKSPFTCSESHGPDPKCVEEGDLPWQWGTPWWDGAWDVAVGGEGQTTVVGAVSGSLDQQTNLRGGDAFATRFAADGTKLWTRQWGTAGIDGALGVALAADGSVYVAGASGGTISGGDLYLSALAMASPSADGFLSKFEADGKQRWIRRIDSGLGDGVSAVAVAEGDGVYVAGATAGDLGGANQGGTDLFVGLYSSSGERVWLDQFGGVGAQIARALAIDAEGGVYVTGLTDVPIDEAEEGTAGAFLIRYAADGERRWIRQWGTPGQDAGHAVVLSAGRIYVAGTAPAEQGDEEQLDAALSSWNDEGVQLWARRWGSATNDDPQAMTVDHQGAIVVAGITQGPVFDGQAGLGGEDVFVSKFTADGDRTWTRLRGTAGNDRARGVATDRARGTIVVGATAGDLAGGNLGHTDLLLLAIPDDL